MRHASMRRIASAGIAGACACLIGACSTASTGANAPSALDPASIVPASAPVYVSVTVRPRGALAQSVTAAVDALGGGALDRQLEAKLDHAVSRTGVSYAKDVEPWLGQRVAVALLGVPTGSGQSSVDRDLLIVAPTSDPTAARAFVAKQNAHPGPTNIRSKVIGGYVLAGEPSTLAQITTATPAVSLATDPTFTRATAAFGDGAVATLYVRPAPFVPVLRALIRTQPQASVFLAGLSKVSPSSYVAADLAVVPHRLSVDVVSSGLPKRRSAANPGVGGLPGTAWLALSLGGLQNASAELEHSASGLSAGAAASPLLGGAGAAAQRLESILRTIGPALGPLQLAASGTTLGSLGVGLAMTPRTPGAEVGLIALLRAVIAKKEPTTSVPGGFSVTALTGQRALVTALDGKLVATFGGFSPQSFLHPTGTFAHSSLYSAAQSMLPAGSTVSLALRFAPIDAFLTEFAHSAQAVKAERVIGRLDEIAAGGVAGHFRIALSFN